MGLAGIFPEQSMRLGCTPAGAGIPPSARVAGVSQNGRSRSSIH